MAPRAAHNEGTTDTAVPSLLRLTALLGGGGLARTLVSLWRHLICLFFKINLADLLVFDALHDEQRLK